MKDIKFGFVILHYGDVNMTFKCIETILAKVKYMDYQIVIVDNKSPDGSGLILQEKYKNHNSISVLLNESNLGFANGNNRGYKYIKDNHKCNMICVMNNDVLLLQEDFIELIISEHNKSGFGVLGPHVTLPENKENVLTFNIENISFYEKELIWMERLSKYYSSKLYPIRNIINRSLDFLMYGMKFKKRQIREQRPKEDFYKKYENIILHGCCLVFSPLYVDTFDDCFSPETFMFREEEILYLRCMAAKIKIIYQPEIDVLHLEDVATNSTYKTDRARELFKCENQVKSLGVLINKIKDYEFSK